MKNIFKISAAIVAVLALTPSYATLDLELNQGVSSAIPIAISSFGNDSAAAVPGNQALTQIISNDLNNSGQFRVKNAANAQADASTFNFSTWRSQNVNDVVVGQVNALSGGKYQVQFRLIGLYGQNNGKQMDLNSATLLNQSFTTNQAGLRTVAHHISDLVYEKLTGIHGIFNTKIAYIVVNRQPNLPGRPMKSDYRLEVADIDGFNPQTLLTSTQPIMSPSWSPDGKNIAYVSFENHEAAIYFQNIYNAHRQLVTRFPGINGAPAFSPDGRKMALVLTLSGNPKVYSLDIASKKLTQVTQGYAIDTEPAFSPDGKSMIFTSNRGGTPQIYRYNFATGQTDRITFSGDYNARALYLPDESGIVMMHREGGSFSIADQNLTSGQLNILSRAGNDESPSLAPNGQMVVYATQSGNRGVLAMVSTNGRIKLTLPARNGSVQEPAWSPYLHG
jgi:TolB protein